jgi:cellobiose transport system permease protein
MSKQKVRSARQMERHNAWGRFSFKASPYLFISPFFIVFAIVGLFPLLYTAYISTRKWNNIAGDMGTAICQAACGHPGAAPSWFSNFEWVFNQPTFWVALRNTFGIFILSSVPQIIIALFLAVMLSANLKAHTFWRMGVLLPYIIAPMAAGIIFSALFEDQSGTINNLLIHLGIGAIPWHTVPGWSWLAIATIVNFRWIGYNTLILLAAMQAVPGELYEAAAIDGAGAWRQFFSVTLPQLRPTLIFVIITSVIGGLQIFDEPQMFSISTSYGGNNNQFTTITQFLWKTGFVSSNDSNMGRAAAIAWVLFIIVVIFAILSFFLTSRISGADTVSKEVKKAQKKAAKQAQKQLRMSKVAQNAAGKTGRAGVDVKGVQE